MPWLRISLALLAGGMLAAQQELVLCDFEAAALPKIWEYKSGNPRLIEEGALQGRRSLEITFDPEAQYSPAYLVSFRLESDWSDHDALVLDVFNPNDEPMRAYVLIADQAWRDGGSSYWNRHNGSRFLAPGRTRWTIPVRGLYRGEAGSRNNDIPRDIDPGAIVRVDFGFGSRGQSGRVVIDQLRLVKATRPPGVWAFDFGPPSQQLLLGWTPVSHETAYTPERGYGWGPRGGHPWNGAARDTTFGTVLLRDFCEAGGYRFRIDVPEGRYRVTAFFECSGYWGGEQARHRERRILAGRRVMWSAPRADGGAHALHRFEEVEPVGADIWTTYMEPELAHPATFELTAGKQGLDLGFEADRVWGSKVAALVVCRKRDRTATKWLANQLDGQAKEFRGAAVCLDSPAHAFDPPPAWRRLDLVAWPVGIEDELTPNATPPPGSPAKPADLEISRLVVRDERESLALALRPLRDLGRCRLELEPFPAESRIQASVQRVWYSTSRGFGNIAWRTRAHTLRPVKEIALPKGVTREVVVTARIDRETPPGRHEGHLVLKSLAGRELLRVPLRLTVSPVTLERETDFLMGFFGLMPPGLVPEKDRWEILELTLCLLRESGFNAVSGGPSWTLKRWDDGRPLIDFGEMDRFFALLGRYGFDRPLNGYGGARFRGLHQGYERGAVAEKVERESGLPYAEALMRAWGAVDSHAREARWPTIFYAMCDETRGRARAERELDFMRLMARVSTAYPRTLRTSGSYSIGFAQRPTNRDELLFWHQRFFEALDVSSLNRHDPTVMAEALELGKEIHIYNQGRTRYSFGLYQWSEYRQGVRARWQWHLNVLHGYQFFDLDGREPDTAMICYGRDQIYPTIHFERCREGVEDFLLYETLWKRVHASKDQASPGSATSRARALLEDATDRVRLDQRSPPSGFDADAFKAEVVTAIEALQ